MVNNGTLHYDHDRDGTHTQLAGCEAKFRNLEYDTHVSIKYERDVLTGKRNGDCIIKLVNFYVLQCLPI